MSTIMLASPIPQRVQLQSKNGASSLHTATLSRSFLLAPGSVAVSHRAQLSSVVTRANRLSPEVDPHGERYANWDDIHKQILFKYELPSISAQDAAAMIEDGKAVLLDVRLQRDHDESHPAPAVAAPAFRIIEMSQGGGFSRILKMGLMAMNGVTPTEPHPDFVASAKAAAGADKAVIVACEAGGSSVSTVSFPKGKASRSLKAAWKLLATDTLPSSRVYHLEGGVLGWYKADLPMSGEYNEAKAYKSPNAVAAAENSAAAETADK